MKQLLDTKIVDLLDLKHTKGDVGIEIEMELETPYISTKPFKNVWRLEGDGSLKVNGVEFVLKKPVEFSYVGTLIDNLKVKLKENDMTILPSIRAGVHVHVNMQQSTLGQMYNMLGCYYPMETVLTRFCGNGREGNLFCLRSRDAAGALKRLELSIKQEALHYLDTDDIRYAALNIRSLFNYGTLEFRALATTPDLGLIEDWTKMVQKLKEYSERVNSCWDCMYHISGNGGRSWLMEVFGPELFAKLDYPDLERDIIRDSRNCQYLNSLITEATHND